MALICGVQLLVCHFPIGILGQVWYLIVSIPDLCTLTYLIYIMSEANIDLEHADTRIIRNIDFFY